MPDLPPRRSATRRPDIPPGAAAAFASAEEAWMWTMAALIARRDGARYGAGKGTVRRPCEPDDVVRCVDQLYRQRRIGPSHARVLRIWGERQLPPEGRREGGWRSGPESSPRADSIDGPDGRVGRDSQDRILWLEAMVRLEWVLRAKGIVA